MFVVCTIEMIMSGKGREHRQNTHVFLTADEINKVGCLSRPTRFNRLKGIAGPAAALFHYGYNPKKDEYFNKPSADDRRIFYLERNTE